MSVDACSSHAVRDSNDTATMTLQRRALYFTSGERKIFGWYHAPTPDNRKPCAAVICNPLGYEYTHSHRSLRHLAETLADNGIATLRFDYGATGDSPDEDLAPNRLACWLQDIRAAIATVRSLSGQFDICLIGVRMGAALAALVASADTVAHLVLWNPCSGKHYVREMKALARTAATTSDSTLGFESAGFTLLHETAEQLKEIDLLKLPFRAECDVLLLQRDDIDSDPALERHLRDCGADVTSGQAAGYADMMAEPQFTVVPVSAIAQITDWLATKSATTATSTAPPAENSVGFSETLTAQDDIELIERCYQFGEEKQLFGITTLARGNSRYNEKPAIVLLNSGSVHRVGPNRLYVTLTRTLAAHGFLCFRFDLHGLGDSPAAIGTRENHPYPNSAINDTQSALAFLQNEFGCSRFILAGLCSGAHTAFHAAIALTGHDIVEAVLINPLTYGYVEGMSLKTTQHFQDVEYYKKSARSLNSWKKLLRGQVDLQYLASIAGSQLKITASALLRDMCERFYPKAAPQLAKNLQILRTQRRPLSLFIADGDPGYALLMAGARHTATQHIKRGWIQLRFIAGGDHTFSTRKPRNESIDLICEHINTRFGSHTTSNN